jgi:hypothetical protein
LLCIDKNIKKSIILALQLFNNTPIMSSFTMLPLSTAQLDIPYDEDGEVEIETVTLKGVYYSPGKKPAYFTNPNSPWGFENVQEQYPHSDSPSLMLVSIPGDGVRIELGVDLVRGLVEEQIGSGTRTWVTAKEETLNMILSVLPEEVANEVREDFNSALKGYEDYKA